MAVPGRKPKPTLQVVREGNPGKRPVKDSVVLPPSPLVEPEWPSGIDDRCSQLWRRLAPVLARSAGLVGEMQETLVDYCVTVARIEQGERVISDEGMVVTGAMGGPVKNPWHTALNGYRAHLRSLTGELGLSPSSAARLTRPESSDDDDPFD